MVRNSHVTETITHSRLREGGLQTYRGFSLSEEIVNMSTGTLSAPLVLDIINVTALFLWNQRSALATEGKDDSVYRTVDFLHGVARVRCGIST